MRLRKKQSKFAVMQAMLVLHASMLGYEVTIGDGYRDPRVFGKMGEKKGYGRARSAHKQRLAMDFNLFINDKWVTTTEGHKTLGEYWESIGGTWGGRWNDGNHYSLAHRGIK